MREKNETLKRILSPSSSNSSGQKRREISMKRLDFQVSNAIINRQSKPKDEKRKWKGID